MKQSIRRFLTLPWMLGILLVPCIGLAEQKQGEKAAILSPWLYKELQKADELIAKPAYAEALDILNKALPEVGKSTYEEAAILRTIASVNALKGEYREAAAALEKSIATKALPEPQESEAQLSLGRLYLAMDDSRRAVAILETWLQGTPSVDAETHILLANAYARQKQYRKAIPHVEKAIGLSDKKAEDWYQLLLALNYESGNFSACAEVLTTLIQRYSDKKEYWQQLTAIYQRLNQNSKALAVKNLAYRLGFLTGEGEILELANLYLYLKAPYKASHLLQQEIERGRVKTTSKNWELLADAWSLARDYERAISALKKASHLDANGEIQFRLGRLYIEQENWREAETALTDALGKGGLKQPGEAYLLLGICHHELKQQDKAQQAFVKAQSYSKTRESAQQWLNYLAAEPA